MPEPTSAGPCFVSPIMYPHLHCGLPVGHEGLHRCFTSVTWGENSGIDLRLVEREEPPTIPPPGSVPTPPQSIFNTES